MNKLDIFTVAVVLLCVLAIVFLLWRATGLFQEDRPEPADQVDAIERRDVVRPPEPTVPLDDNVDGNADTDLLDRAGEAANRAGGAVRDAVDNVAEDLEETAEEIAEATRDGVRETKDELEIPTSYDSKTGQFFVMGGSFSVHENAIRQRNILRGAGFPSAEVTSFNGGRYSVVLVDRFVKYSDAKATVGKVRAEVPDAYVMRQRFRRSQR